MSDKDVNKVHELAEHEDQKTFQYMLQGKDNGRIKLGNAADNADLIKETPEKKRKKEFEDLLIKTAGMIALEKADEAIQGMAGAIKAMGKNLDKAQKYIDRSDYLRDQMITITALLQNGTEDAKLRYLMEQGYSQDQIDQVKAGGDADTHLRNIGRGMAEEDSELRKLIEAEAKSYTENEEKYLRNRDNAETALKKAEAEGNTAEAERRREEIETLDTDYAELQKQYGETILDFENKHSDFDEVLGEFSGSNSKYVGYENLAENHLDKANEQLSVQLLNLSKDFEKASKSMEQVKANDQEIVPLTENTTPVINTGEPSF